MDDEAEPIEVCRESVGDFLARGGSIEVLHSGPPSSAASAPVGPFAAYPERVSVGIIAV